MIGGASSDPIAVPALIIPIAVERSDGSIHSATTRVAAGKAPPSPIPSRTWRSAATQTRGQAVQRTRHDHHTIISRNPCRVPAVQQAPADHVEC